MTATLTIADFLPLLESHHDPATTPVHGHNCLPFSHSDQPTVQTLVEALKPLSTTLTIDALPILPCGCFNLLRIKAMVGPQIKYIGMNNY